MAPAGRQPLKRDQPQSPFADRLAMVELACQNHPPLIPSDIDAPRPDGRFNYTCDTLEQLRNAHPKDDLFCLIGADSLQTLRQWHRAAEALMLAQWIIAARPRFPPSFPAGALNSLLPDSVQAGPPEAQDKDCFRVPLTAGASNKPSGSCLTSTTKYPQPICAPRSPAAQPASQIGCSIPRSPNTPAITGSMADVARNAKSGCPILSGGPGSPNCALFAGWGGKRRVGYDQSPHPHPRHPERNRRWSEEPALSLSRGPAPSIVQ